MHVVVMYNSSHKIQNKELSCAVTLSFIIAESFHYRSHPTKRKSAFVSLFATWCVFDLNSMFNVVKSGVYNLVWRNWPGINQCSRANTALIFLIAVFEKYREMESKKIKAAHSLLNAPFSLLTPAGCGFDKHRRDVADHRRRGVCDRSWLRQAKG